MSFENLGLRAELVAAVTAKGYTQPTPIQAQAIPPILAGRDLLGGSQTGTGKTAAFTLPMLQILAEQQGDTSRGKHVRKAPRALVLTPTRELAAQVGESVETYGAGLNLKSTIVFGGVGINPQINKLRAGVDIVIATPGRLLDHASQRTVDLSRIEFLILDEADRMLDMGFIHDIRKILKLLPARRQNLLFSATYSNEIKQLSDGILHDPELIEVARRNTAAEKVTQVVHPVAKADKRSMLSHLIRTGNWSQVLVFTRTKHGANRLTKQLDSDGITASAIHGNKSQNARTQALADFKTGRVRVLVATDVASRGLDISLLPHVVNFELPNVPEDYVHRIGRTGRAGEEGAAHSLVSLDERGLLRDIEKVLGRSIPVQDIEGFKTNAADGNEDARVRPTRGGGSRGQSSGRGSSSRSSGGRSESGSSRPTGSTAPANRRSSPFRRRSRTRRATSSTSS
ncbi:MAG: DEAD/DEAH box helicase [Verrucomicrobiales bacterium]